MPSLPRWLQLFSNPNTELAKKLQRPALPSLTEAWLEAAIDAGLWTVVNPATGTPWTLAIHATGHRVAWAKPIASENCRLYSNVATIYSPLKLQTDAIARVVCLEFEMKLTTVANIDNAATFWGFISDPLFPWRTSDDIVGWCLTGDALASLSDEGGVETTNTTFGETLTNFNKLRIELSYGHAKFYVNEVLKADHITNLTALINTPSWYMATEGTGQAYIYIGALRTWMEDVAR